MNLKYFGMEINASCGPTWPGELAEAFGAFLLENSGLCFGGITTELCPDETFEFSFKGNVWRLSFILVYDVQLSKKVAFRIHFDFVRKETQ